MKILLIAHGSPLSEYGGVGLYVESIAKGLALLQHEIIVVTPKMASIQKPYFKTHIYGWGQHWELVTPFARNWIDSWSHRSCHALLKSTLINLVPDVIHIHHLDGLPLNFWSFTPQNCFKAITLHDYAIPCARGQLVNADQEICLGPNSEKCAACLGHRLRPHPWLQIFRKWFTNPYFQSIGKAVIAPKTTHRHHVGQVHKRLSDARRLLHECDLLLSPSMHLQSRMKALQWPEPRFLPLPLLTDIQPLPPPPPSPKRLIYSSRIAPTKGLHLILEAIKKCNHRDISLTIIGQTEGSDSWPNYADHIKKLIQLRQSEGYQVQYQGHRSHSEVIRQLHQHHVFLLPSLWPENAPISAREAAAAGLQIICNQDSGAMEMSPEAIGIQPTEGSIANAINNVSTDRITLTNHMDLKAHCWELQSAYLGTRELY